MIIGIAGSFAAGKGAAVAYLKQKGFEHYSAADFIAEEVVRRGMPMNRDSLIATGNDLRRQNGPAYIIDQLYARASGKGGDAVIESLRAVAEARRIKELGGVVLGITADTHVRYERARARGSAKDNVSYEEFLEHEKQESEANDPTKQNIFGALAESDYLIDNNGTLEELHARVDSVLKKLHEHP